MQLTETMIKEMGYVDFMALLDETNRPPGGVEAVLAMLHNTFATSSSVILDVGCNTGYCTYEIARLVGARVTGIDINANMVEAANRNKAKFVPAAVADKVDFRQSDARTMPFEDNSFDIVMSGGSTAFIHDIPAALQEYRRVCKDYGLIADINFFYPTPPPDGLVARLNQAMGTDIQPWDSRHWENMYEAAGLEKITIINKPIDQVGDEKLARYADHMAARVQASPAVKQTIHAKLTEVMSLFNENHRYLSSGVFIYRKNPAPYEMTLFE